MAELSYGQLKISRFGNVGIGSNAPSSKLEINLGTTEQVNFKTWTDAYIDNSGAYGSICFFPQEDYYLQLGKSGHRIGQIWACEIKGLWSIEYSDQRIKSNIRPIENPISRLRKVNGVQYCLSEDYLSTIPKNSDAVGMEYGFIAQELEQVFPELVMEDTVGGLKGVKYTRLIPILVEAVKAQQNMIDSLREQYQENLLILKNEILELKRSLEDSIPDNKCLGQKKSTGSTMTQSSKNTIYLSRIFPNPTKTSFVIQGYIPYEVKKVRLNVVSSMGSSYNVDVLERGNIEILIPVGSFEKGVYTCFLVGDEIMSEPQKVLIQ